MIKAIFATDMAGAFGLEGGLPWPPLREDFQHFKNITMGNYVAMGYSTYKTLPKLKNRHPIVVLDTNRELPELGSHEPMYTGLDSFVQDCHWFSTYGISDVSIIGGTSLLVPKYLEHCSEIYHTTIKDFYKADTYIPNKTLEYLDTLKSTVILETDNCIIKKYT
jgi:dihydrofolate reductase